MDAGVSRGNEIRVLGIDPGSRATGWGVVREVSGQATLVAAGVLRIGHEKDLSLRLRAIFAQLSEIIAEHEPHEAAVENVFHAKNAMSALKLGQARGAAVTACAVCNLPVFEYEPTKIKLNLVGVGRADKAQVSFMVGRILGVKPDWASDAGDALAAAVCRLNERRMAKLTQAAGLL